MTQRRLLSLSCFIVTILIAIGCNTKGNLPKNWKIELNQNSKDPYGLYIAHEEIGFVARHIPGLGCVAVGVVLLLPKRRGRLRK